MGCGRVGSSLAISLEAKGHEVAVIDQDGSAFRRLGTTFEGRRVQGVGFDRDTLREAGIERAYAFAAVSSGDNSNILAARVARETFGVENVVARIYDPGRAEVYQRLGIPTVATVRWTSDQMIRRLLPKGATPGPPGPERARRRRRGAAGRLAGSVSGSAGSRPTAPAAGRLRDPARRGLLPGPGHRLPGRRHRARAELRGRPRAGQRRAQAPPPALQDSPARPSMTRRTSAEP